MNEERLSLALAGTTDAVFDWDLRANKLYLAPRFTELFGQDASTGAPTDWFDRVHPEGCRGAADRAHRAPGRPRRAAGA